MAASTSPSMGAPWNAEAIENAEDGVDHGKAGGADEQQEATAAAVDGRKREHGEDYIDGAGDDDIEEDAGDLVAGGGEDLLRIIEDNVDAAPLLKHGEHKAEYQRAGNTRLSEFAAQGNAASLTADLLEIVHNLAGVTPRPRAAPGDAAPVRCGPGSPTIAGFQGTKNVAMRKSSEGTAVTPNIQRQAAWPFQERRISAGGAARAQGGR